MGAVSPPSSFQVVYAHEGLSLMERKHNVKVMPALALNRNGCLHPSGLPKPVSIIPVLKPDIHYMKVVVRPTTAPYRAE